MIQNSKRQAQIFEAFFARHTEVIQNQHNINVLAHYIKGHYQLCGETVIGDTELELALLSCMDRLQLQGGPTADQVMRVNAENERLKAEQARVQAEQAAREAEQRERQAQLDEQRKRDLLRAELIAKQEASAPGAASAFGDRDELAAKKAKEEAAARKGAANHSLKLAFLEELRRIDGYLAMTTDGSARVNYAKTAEAKAEMKALLKRKYPFFADLVK